MKLKVAVLTGVLVCSTACMAQNQKPPQPSQVVGCGDPQLAAPSPGYKDTDVVKQPDNTADLPSVVQTVEQALRCYQALTQEADPLQPKGLPKLSSVVMDFKTTTGETVGASFSFFIFKIGASREKDVTDDISFTYSVPKPAPPVRGPKPKPATLYDELVKEVQAAARAAQAQSTALGMPLSKVAISISFGVKFDGNISINAPVQLITIGGNGDYNKNNTQTLQLTFGQ